MLTEVIYKRDATGNIRVWQAEAFEGKWRSITGVLGGTMITSEWSVCVPRSQPTAELQAEFEAKAQKKKNLDKDYRPSLALVDVPRGSFIKPMLAQKYTPSDEHCFIQPKLDGMRCLANTDGLWSRTGKPIIAIPQIFERMQKELFTLFPYVVFDGELYNHAFVNAAPRYSNVEDDNGQDWNVPVGGFDRLMGILKKQHPTEADIQLCLSVSQYHIYDCYNMQFPNWNFKQRNAFLNDLKLWSTFEKNRSIQFVQTIECEGKKDVDFYHETFVADGYEGSMVRFNAEYEQKRSKFLLKKKDFITEEFELLRIEEGEGNWRGYAKRIVFKPPNGGECGAGLRGDRSFCQTLLNEDVTSFESVTIRHFGTTPDGSIRFPVAIEFNRKGSLESRPVLDSNSNDEEI